MMSPHTHPQGSQLSAPARPRQHEATKDISPSSFFILEGISVSILGREEDKEQKERSQLPLIHNGKLAGYSDPSWGLELFSRMKIDVLVNLFLNQVCLAT